MLVVGQLPRRALVVLLALLAVAVVGPSAAHASDPGGTLGVYVGSDPSAMPGYEHSLGRKVARGHDFLVKSTWSSMIDVRWMAESWVRAGYAKKMVLTVPMLPNDVPSGYGPLANGAAGKYNSYFHTLAQQLVQYGMGSAVLRLGHEFNGSWFKWTTNVANGPADYAAYWRKIVDTMRSVNGAHFKFDWSPNSDGSWVNGQQLQAADAWPGVHYVDYVGLSLYDQSWVPNFQDPVARWNGYLSQPNGLNWQANFAASKGKPLTFTEWGLSERNDGHGGGDAPYFIQQMYNWIQSHNVAYNLYFEHTDPDGQSAIFSGRFPNAAQTFIRLFGGGSATSSSLGFGEFARLCIDRARISRQSRRLNLEATITQRASGSAHVELRAGGRRTKFRKTINGGRVTVSRKLSRKQARRGTGVLTLSYGGNTQTKPQRVRLVIGPRKANLRLAVAPNILGDRLTTNGTISKRARGRVRLQLAYEVNGQTVTHTYSAKIRKGRWRLNAQLTQLVRDEIAGRASAVHAYALYPGSLKRRIGGQMKPFQLLAGR